jgi:HK97 family phage portal protein
MGMIANMEKRMASGALDDSWYQPGGFFFGGMGTKTKSGSSISEFNAMQLAIVWCCIKIISEDSASLPLHLYKRRKSGGKDKATADDRYYLLHDQPNPEMTAMSFRETYAAHLLSWGNGYAEKQLRGSVGKIEALWPITPDRITVKRNDKKQIIYKIKMGGTSLQDVILPKRQVLHTPGLSFNGLIGYSPIAAAREAMGLGKTLEEFGATYFENGIRPSFVVSVKGTLKNPTARREALEEVYSGLSKAHRVMLLEEAEKVEKLGIPNDEAQFLESRKFQNVDIGSRIYRLSPQQYGEYDKASTYASAEQFAIDYVTKTLRCWLVRLEQSYNMNLLDPSEYGEYYFEHNIEGLLRGDIKSRYEAYQIGRNNGWLNPDEIRELENLNPMEGGQGQIYLVPLNMIPASELNQNVKKDDQNSIDNHATYRARLESAYQRIFVDAAERIIRKETKRLRWGFEKHNNGNFAAFADDFYKELPEFIKRQVLPAFMSFLEAIIGMETELNGLKLNGQRPEFERFIAKEAEKFAENYAKNSHSELMEAVKNGSFDDQINELETERAQEIAGTQVLTLGNSIIEHLKAVKH